MSHELERKYNEIINVVKEYHPNENTSMIREAYNFACIAHEGQFRKSGDPFVLHPIETALILANLKVDKETVVAALLHDVVEDTNYSFSDIEGIFGKEIATLVKGVTKLEKIHTKDREKKTNGIDNIKHLLLSSAEDIRIILIKLADRLHNMRTLAFQPVEKQIRIAQETLDIYVPIASKMGIFCVQVELEDLCLRYLDNESYFDIKEKLEKLREEHNVEDKRKVQLIQTVIEKEGTRCTVSVEYKHYFSIYRKMRNRNQTMNEMFDLSEVKIVVNSIRECYEVMGYLHNTFTPIPGRIKDFIATPKANLYRAIHTTLIPEEGMPFAVQIMTEEMDVIAQYGILAYWKYKETEFSENTALEKVKLTWLKDVLEWQRESNDEIFDQLIKNEFNVFNEKIYCYTPKGKCIELPVGANVIDFAYYVHSELGDKLVSGRINNKLVEPIEKLNNGDVVQLITGNSGNPPFFWIKEVKTSKAKNKLLKWYKGLDAEKLLEMENAFLDLCESRGFRARKDINEIKKKICGYYKISEWNVILTAAYKGEVRLKNCISEVIHNDAKKYKKIKLGTSRQIGHLIEILNVFLSNEVSVISVDYKENGESGAVIDITYLNTALAESVYGQLMEIDGIVRR